LNRIAVFGKPGGGKSTLSKKLSSLLGIPIYPLDLIEYKKNGEKIPIEDYKKSHSDLLDKENWIIEGLGSIDSFWLRVESADTLIYVDLPYWQHYWFTVKRLLISPFLKPEGWPEGSSIWKGTISSWRYLRLSPS
jgi:adenylate kinase family enzyme